MRKAIWIGLVSWFVVGIPGVSAEESREVDSEMRPSMLSLELARNPRSLNSFSLGIDLGVSETVGVLTDLWSDELPDGSSRSRANRISLGVDVDFSDDFSASLVGIQTTLPDSVYGRGGELAGVLRSRAWKFGLALRALRYTSDRSVSGRRLRDDGIPERSVSLSIGYRFSSEWAVRLATSRYGYGGATVAELSDILSSRPSTSAGMLSVVEGFPERTGSLGVVFSPEEHWDLGLSFAKTRYELAPEATSATASVDFQLTSQWGLGLSGTSLRQDGDRNGSVVSFRVTSTW